MDSTTLLVVVAHVTIGLAGWVLYVVKASEFRESPGPEPPAGTGESPNEIQKALVDLAVESWRFNRSLDPLLRQADEQHRRRFEGRLLWYRSQMADLLASTGIRLVNIEGQPWEEGTAAAPVNADEFGTDDVLVVDGMMEPIVMGPNGLLRMGTVTLRRQEAETADQ